MAGSRRFAAAIAAAAVFGASAAFPAPSATPAPDAGTTGGSSPTVTLGTGMVRNFAGFVDLPEPDVLSRLPDVRLRIDLGRNGWMRGDPSLQGVTGVEIEVPRVPGFWLGVEESETAGELPRATFSIQKKF